MIQAPILPGISIRLIQLICAEHYEIDLEAIRGPCRERKFAWPRQIAIALCLEFLPQKSSPSIGYYFGGRDHSTVVSSQRAALERASNDPEVCADFAKLREAIEAHRPARIQPDIEMAA